MHIPHNVIIIVYEICLPLQPTVKDAHRSLSICFPFLNAGFPELLSLPHPLFPYSLFVILVPCVRLFIISAPPQLSALMLTLSFES